MRRLWFSALTLVFGMAFVLTADRTWTGKISDNRVTWTEEGVLLFRSSESWTKGGRRQESEGPLLDCGELWADDLVVVQGSCRLPCFMAARER
jgi:hypothetical protein